MTSSLFICLRPCGELLAVVKEGVRSSCRLARLPARGRFLLSELSAHRGLLRQLLLSAWSLLLKLQALCLSPPES